jgi:hypothetical protein
MHHLFKIYFVLAALNLTAQRNSDAYRSALSREVQTAIDYALIQSPDVRIHSAFRPYTGKTLQLLKDSLVPFKFYGFKPQVVSAGKSKAGPLNILPLLELEPGYSALEQQLRSYTAGGLQIRWQAGRQLMVSANLLAGQARLPFYMDTLLKEAKILPEFGLAKAEGGQYRFADLSGYLSWTSKNRVFNLQAGRDKHFVGDGYRSILLSDFAAPYPYLSAAANIWKLQYNVWYTLLNDPTAANGRRPSFRNKYGAFHYLSFNPHKSISIGIFENVIWRGSDTSQSRIYELNYLNPLVFYRPQEYAIGSPDNSFLGLNLAVTVARRLKIYGQLGLDEFYLKEVKAGNGWWANKQAWQGGFKYVRAFGLKGLMLQAEYNQVRPYTYSHGLTDQNYGHYGMPLAHPLGANFKEGLFLLQYLKGRWQFGADVTLSRQGKDSTRTGLNYGSDIFRSYTTRQAEYGNYTGQGVLHTLRQSHLRLAYLLVPSLQLKLEGGYIQRWISSSAGYSLQEPYVYLSLKTALWNRYRDY